MGIRLVIIIAFTILLASCSVPPPQSLGFVTVDNMVIEIKGTLSYRNGEIQFTDGENQRVKLATEQFTFSTRKPSTNQPAPDTLEPTVPAGAPEEAPEAPVAKPKPRPKAIPKLPSMFTRAPKAHVHKAKPKPPSAPIRRQTPKKPPKKLPYPLCMPDC